MRSKILSTQRVRFYKLINLTIWLVLLALIIIHLIRGADFFLFYWIIYWGLGFYKLYFQRVRLLRNIEYDQANLYIVDKGQEIEIPFHEVKDIKLRSVLGTHSIAFFRDFGLGKDVFFKSSLWYPFNFRRVDDQVYELKKRIDTVKRQQYQSMSKGLPSQSV